MSLILAMSKHALDPAEKRLDHEPPGKVVLRNLRVTRGHASSPGDSTSDADLGIIEIDVVPPADNRTPTAKMGYRIRRVGGILPGANLLPGYDVRAHRDRTGRRYLRFVWIDGATATHPPLNLVISVAAVDLAGNVGPPTRLSIRHPPAGTALLTRARFTSTTSDDNKDCDTGVFVHVFTRGGKKKIAEIENADRSNSDATEYNDYSRHSVDLHVVGAAEKRECTDFLFKVGSCANGNDKWKIGDAQVELSFSDGTVLTRNTGSFELNSRGSSKVERIFS